MMRENKKYLVIILIMLWPVLSIAQAKRTNKIPVILLTDLYFPYEDPGDNFDLIIGYALPGIDLKAIILDITDAFRKPIADAPFLWADPNGPREAGIIPVMQLNYIFNKNIPFATGPFSPMQTTKDKMQDLPDFQQQGVELLLETLKKSKEKVSIMSFGSARVLAVAYNRDPGLLLSKIKMIYLSAGTATENFQLGKDPGANAIPGGEWNVALDVNAFVCILRSQLPIALYPCAGKDGAFALDKNNTFWDLPDLEFIRKMDIKLQRYLDYSFLKVLRYDFLRAMDVGETADSTIIAKHFPSPHHVWETALWLDVSQRKLIERKAGGYEIIPLNELQSTDKILNGELKRCIMNTRDDGRFTFKFTDKASVRFIYEREDPAVNEKALRQALPGLYESFKVK